MKNSPIIFKIFLFIIMIFVPLFSTITIYQDFNYLINTEAHPIFEAASYSKTAIKIIILLYCVFTSYTLIKIKNHAYGNALALTILLFASPFIIEIPFFILEWWADTPAFVIKQVYRLQFFSSLFAIVFLPFLLKSKWVKATYKR